jgi:peroxiredoxin
MKTFFLFIATATIVCQMANAQQKPKPVLFGDTFPEFMLASHEGKQVSMSDLKNKNVMLVFPRGKALDNFWCAICQYQYVELAKLETEKNIKKKYNLEILFVLPYIKDTVMKWIETMPESMANIEKWKNPDDPSDEKQKRKAESIRKVCPQTITFKDNKIPMPFPVLIDADRALSTKLDIFRLEWDGTKTAQNIPAIYILDKTGKVKFKYLGQNTLDRIDGQYLLKFVEKML